ncbi:MAG: hypothetical protein WCI79_03125 [Candidatus Saccharibacteria bacterium]
MPNSILQEVIVFESTSRTEAPPEYQGEESFEVWYDLDEYNQDIQERYGCTITTEPDKILVLYAPTRLDDSILATFISSNLKCKIEKYDLKLDPSTDQPQPSLSELLADHILSFQEQFETIIAMVDKDNFDMDDTLRSIERKIFNHDPGIIGSLGRGWGNSITLMDTKEFVKGVHRTFGAMFM